MDLPHSESQLCNFLNLTKATNTQKKKVAHVFLFTLNTGASKPQNLPYTVSP